MAEGRYGLGATRGSLILVPMSDWEETADETTMGLMGVPRANDADTFLVTGATSGNHGPLSGGRLTGEGNRSGGRLTD